MAPEFSKPLPGADAAASASRTDVQQVTLALLQPLPSEVPVGSDVPLQVRVSCAAASDLRGGVINVVAAEEILASRELILYRDGGNETAEATVKAPDRLGAFDFVLVFPRQEIAGIAYEESSLALSVATKPHETSLAVWDIPSPVPVGDRFSIKVGAKSSGACDLKGAQVEVLDQAGGKIARGTFGDAPWPGTSALYWAEIELTAPPSEGLHSWSVAFAAGKLTLPHLAASTAFGLATVKPPEHRLTVKVVESELAAPIGDVQLGLGPYRAATDDAGLATIEAAPGRYQLDVWQAEFEFSTMDVEIADDTIVQVELTRLPKERSVWD